MTDDSDYPPITDMETDESTDPSVFVHRDETTVRRCANCGVALGPCDCDKKFKAGAVAILEALFRLALRKGVQREVAIGIVDDVTRESGLELV